MLKYRMKEKGVSYCNRILQSFFWYSSSSLWLPTLISIELLSHIDLPRPLPSAYSIPEAILIALVIISITITSSRGLNTDP